MKEFDRIIEKLNNNLENKIGNNDFKTISSQIQKLLDLQQLSEENIEVFESGQSYAALGIGDVVLKVGQDIKCVKNPYQLLPFHQEELSDSNQKLFLSHKANTKNITREDSQKLYNLIRNNGGIWIDAKENNIGRIDNFTDISKSFENNVNLFDTNKALGDYYGNNYIIDYEDVIFLTPEIIAGMDKSSNWSFLPYGNEPGNRIYTKYLESENIDEIYEKNYIYPSERLLNYEKEYQKQLGNTAKVNICNAKLKEIEQRRRQSKYEMEQRYKYGRNNKIGKKYSAKEIGIQVLQKTNLTRLKDMVGTIKSKFKNRLNKDNKNYNMDFNHSENTDPWGTR